MILWYFFGSIIYDGINTVEYTSEYPEDISDTDFLNKIYNRIYQFDSNHIVIYTDLEDNDTTSFTYQSPDEYYYILYPGKRKTSKKPRPSDITPIVTKTGEKKKIMGYDCEKIIYNYNYPTGRYIEAWTTQNFPYNSPVKGYEKILHSVWKEEGLVLQEIRYGVIIEGVRLIQELRVKEIAPNNR